MSCQSLLRLRGLGLCVPQALLSSPGLCFCARMMCWGWNSPEPTGARGQAESRVRVPAAWLQFPWKVGPVAPPKATTGQPSPLLSESLGDRYVRVPVPVSSGCHHKHHTGTFEDASAFPPVLEAGRAGFCPGLSLACSSHSWPWVHLHQGLSFELCSSYKNQCAKPRGGPPGSLVFIPSKPCFPIGYTSGCGWLRLQRQRLGKGGSPLIPQQPPSLPASSFL